MTDQFKRDCDAHEMSYDEKPKGKFEKKYRRRDRQRAKKECRNHVDGTAKREAEDFYEYLAQKEKNKHAGSSFEEFMKEDD